MKRQRLDAGEGGFGLTQLESPEISLSPRLLTGIVPIDGFLLGFIYMTPYIRSGRC